MDTITHGIAGALIAKAFFRGEDMFAAWRNGSKDLLRGSEQAPAPQNHPGRKEPASESGRYMVSRERIVTWSLMLGAIFPDADVFRDLFSHDRMLIVTWHRSITHSLVMFPIWALLLAALTRVFCKWRKWEAPSFAALTSIYGVGLLSHILLDLVTSFGTMIWSPLEWSRPAWDMIFIIDFTLTGLLVIPQFLAWGYSDAEKMKRRVIGLCLVFLPTPFLIARLAESVRAPISDLTVLVTMAILAAVFFLPMARGIGLKIRRVTWNRAGLAAALAYVALTFFAHRVALARIQKFAELDQLHVQSIGALPLPPSLWHWDGLVRAERGVYELRMDLSARPVKDGELLALEHRYFPDAPANSYIEAARRLPEVQKVLWFARFPVTRFRKEGDQAVVEFSDLRFRREGSRQPPGFTYRVRFAADGSLLSQGWATP